MFGKKTQKKLTIVVAVVLSVALLGSALGGLLSLVFNSNTNKNVSEAETNQAQYDQTTANIRVYERMLAENPSNAELSKLLAGEYWKKAASGLSLEEQSDWEKASDAFQVYVAAQEEEPPAEAIYWVAYTSLMAQRYELAKTNYLQLINSGEENEFLLYQYGTLLWEGFGDTSGAIAQWEKAKTLTDSADWQAELDRMIQAAAAG